MIQPAVSGENPLVTRALIAFASGGMIVMAVYGWTLYLFRRGEKAVLYFALICVCAGVRFFVLEGSHVITELIPGISDTALYIARFTSINIFIVGITGFILEFFTPAGRERKMYQVLRLFSFLTYACITVAAVVRGGYDSIPMRLGMVLPTISLQICAFIIIARAPIFHKNRLTRMCFAAS